MDRAKARLDQLGLGYREINIEEDPVAAQRVEGWVGFRSVPTIVVAAEGTVAPADAPSPLPKGSSPRGIDRGDIITEPSNEQLDAFLVKHGFTRSEVTTN